MYYTHLKNLKSCTKPYKNLIRHTSLYISLSSVQMLVLNITYHVNPYTKPYANIVPFVVYHTKYYTKSYKKTHTRYKNLLQYLISKLFETARKHYTKGTK